MVRLRALSKVEPVLKWLFCYVETGLNDSLKKAFKSKSIHSFSTPQVSTVLQSLLCGGSTSELGVCSTWLQTNYFHRKAKLFSCLD